jgi:uncharacterized protein
VTQSNAARRGKRAAGVSRTRPRQRLRSALLRLSALQTLRPLRLTLLGALLTVLGLLSASGLALKTGFEELLPEGQPSVTELRRVLERTAGVSAVHLVLEGDDPARLSRLADALVERLSKVGAPWVSDASSGIHQGLAFLRPRAGLFPPLAALQELRAEVEQRYRRAVAEAVGADLDDEPLPPLTQARVRTLLGIDAADQMASRFPGGYTRSPDGKVVVVVARAAIAAGDLPRMEEALRRVQAAAAEVLARPEHQGLRIGYAGDLVTGLFEYRAVVGDLLQVGALGVGLVLAVVLLFFARLRALLVLGCTLATGCALTFGFTRLAVGHLNLATGFLFSIVAGNGINFGIIWLARYLEERRAGRRPGRALYRAHRTTFSATLTVAVAAATSYGALAVTSFRGFHDFALIGAAGMLLCWASTVLLLPALVAALERLRPFADRVESGLFARLRDQGARYEAPFLFLLERIPASLLRSGIAAAFLGALVCAVWLLRDPLEYDMRRLQSRVQASGELYRVSALAQSVLGAASEGAMVLLCDRPGQVGPLRLALEARKQKARPGEEPFNAVRALQDLVPSQQEEKIPQLLALRERLLALREKGGLDDATWKQVEPVLPPPDLRPFTLEDLPADVARPFTEKDGTRGRLVLIEPTEGKSDNDLRYLLRWADSFRETKLPSGEVLRGSGRAVIFADLLQAALADMPKALLVALVTTVLAVLLAFRAGPGAVGVLLSLFCGLAWLGGALALFGVKLNFLNFMALPITLGVGVDYAVNVRRRALQEGGDALAAVRASGGAVVLCSLTTILGYLALLGSINQGVRSLGLVAVLGEISCLGAALLVLPAALLHRRKRELAGKS